MRRQLRSSAICAPELVHYWSPWMRYLWASGCQHSCAGCRICARSSSRRAAAAAQSSQRSTPRRLPSYHPQLVDRVCYLTTRRASSSVTTTRRSGTRRAAHRSSTRPRGDESACGGLAEVSPRILWGFVCGAVTREESRKKIETTRFDSGCGVCDATRRERMGKKTRRLRIALVRGVR